MLLALGILAALVVLVVLLCALSYVVDRIDAWLDYRRHGTHGRRYYGPGWGDNW